MTTNHTPGPWAVGRKVARFVYAADETPICACDSLGEATKEQELANAKLIAAAPELLDALRNLIESIEYTPLGIGPLLAIKQARAAAAKATA